ncbi:response regulator [Uliginosibacterium sp. 31-12]|uniref:response regulator n=1 Tax=Uliginosibacterium sp. 31-12 TaxID=3062781 RepID=UPI0026E187CE|nr:response regulator [Uliginosibacterium sp. 31-12]MDO6385903.1 response regulator [Uliginosibacterium sp. 31-12]
MDGLDAICQICDPHSSLRRHDLPVVALTANFIEVHRNECLAAGMNDYLSKPLAQESLRVILQRFLRGISSSSA